MEDKKIKLGILLAGFMEWGGGIDFIRYLLMGVDRDKYDYVFLIKRKNNAKIRLKNTIKRIINPIVQKKYDIIYAKSEEEILDNLSELIENNLFFFYTSNRDLERVAISESINILLPAFYSLGKNFSIPWIGYIYDFQHKYLTHLFSANEIKSRDEQFSQIYWDAKKIIVNALQVQMDIERFIGKSTSIDVLPFTPIFSDKQFDDVLTYNVVKKRWNLKNDYFLISNQFWEHKAHLVAFKAFYKLLKQNNNVQLVCTGKLEDNRNKDYAFSLQQFIVENKLEQDIILTGYISKREQISLLKYAKAVIQPTNFEGGPGGGIVYQALGIGIPCIVSDIKVNKEIHSNLVTYFEVNNEDELLEKMKIALLLEKEDTGKNELKMRFYNAQIQLKNKMDNIIKETLVS